MRRAEEDYAEYLRQFCQDFNVIFVLINASILFLSLFQGIHEGLCLNNFFRIEPNSFFGFATRNVHLRLIASHERMIAANGV